MHAGHVQLWCSTTWALVVTQHFQGPMNSLELWACTIQKFLLHHLQKSFQKPLSGSLECGRLFWTCWWPFYSSCAGRRGLVIFLICICNSVGKCPFYLVMVVMMGGTVPHGTTDHNHLYHYTMQYHQDSRWCIQREWNQTQQEMNLPSLWLRWIQYSMPESREPFMNHGHLEFRGDMAMGSNRCSTSSWVLVFWGKPLCNKMEI